MSTYTTTAARSNSAREKLSDKDRASFARDRHAGFESDKRYFGGSHQGWRVRLSIGGEYRSMLLWVGVGGLPPGWPPKPSAIVVCRTLGPNFIDRLFLPAHPAVVTAEALPATLAQYSPKDWWVLAKRLREANRLVIGDISPRGEIV